MIDLYTQTVLEDKIGKIKFSPIVWAADSQGFFYSRFDSETEYSLPYHVLKTNQDQDRLVYCDANDRSLIPCDGGTYWFICNDGSKFYFLTNKDAPFRKIILIDINDPSYMSWIERDGIFASVNVRGGNEYDENWHKEGMRENKQNSIEDFIAAAQWLIDNKYTRC